MMKKILAIVLAVATVLSLGLTSAFAEAREVLDEAAAAEYNHEFFEANQLDALFSRHESIAYTIRFPQNPSRDYFIWETADSVYHEWGLSQAAFSRDHVIYMMTCDEATGELEVLAGVQIDPEYDPYYCVTGETEDDFFRAEHEQIIDFYEEDGLIHFATLYDESLSQYFFEGILGLEYAGQTIQSETVLDAETHEMVEFRCVMEQDGEETVVYLTTVAYDTPEPVASRTLRASFERDSENMMTVKYVVDAGTDHEFIRELTIPVNSESGEIFSNSPAVFFDDVDCETLDHWDRMSDRVYYVFTNPDDELLERFETLTRENPQAQKADEPDAETFEALILANTEDAIISRHANINMKRSTFRDGEEILTETNYTDADTFFWDISDGRAMLRLTNLWVDRASDDEGGIYVETIFDSLENGQAAFESTQDYSVINMPETEKLLETIDAGDGKFTAITEESDPEVVATQLAEILYAGGYEYAEGMTLRYEYTFDTQTSDVLSIHTELTDAEGETLLTQDDRYAFDTEPYDPSAEGEPFAQYMSAALDPEQNRTITLVFDPDTENERVIICVQPQNTFFYVFLNDHYVEDFYTDRECTQLFDTSDGVSDLVLYIK